MRQVQFCCLLLAFNCRLATAGAPDPRTDPNSGRDFRLTDVSGQVVKDILA